MALMMVMVTSADHPGSCHFIEATRTRDIEKAIESLLFSGTHVVFLWLYSSSSWLCSWNADNDSRPAEGVIHSGFSRVEMFGGWLSSAELDGMIHDECTVFVV